VYAFYTCASVCVYIVVVRDGMMKMKRVWVGGWVVGRSDGWMSEFGCHSNGTEFGWPMKSRRLVYGYRGSLYLKKERTE